MSKINLLPSKFAPKPSIVKVTKSLKAVNVIGTIAVFLLITVITFLLVYNNQNIVNTKSDVDRLTATIKALQSVEQKYFYTKNRLTLLQSVIKEKGLIDKTMGFISSVPEGSAISSAKISNEGIKADLEITRSSEIKALIDSLSSLEGVEEFKIKSFLLRQTGSYAVSVDII